LFLISLQAPLFTLQDSDTMPANDDGDILGLAVTKKRKPETPSQNESKKKGKASSTHEKKIPVLDNGWLPPIDKLSKQEFCRIRGV